MPDARPWDRPLRPRAYREGVKGDQLADPQRGTRGTSSPRSRVRDCWSSFIHPSSPRAQRSEEHTSELQSRGHLVCRLLLEKKKQNTNHHNVLHHTKTT